MKEQRGIISTIVIIIVALILLKIFFKLDIFDIINDPDVRSVLAIIWDIIVKIWYIAVDAAQYIWKQIGMIANRMGF